MYIISECDVREILTCHSPVCCATCRKTIINRRTMRHKTQQVQESHLPKRYLRSKLSAYSSSSGEENDVNPSHTRSKSPALPPRPRQTIINRALSPSKSSDNTRHSRAESEASVEIHIPDSVSGSPGSRTSSRSSPVHQEAKSDGEGILVDALLKIILQSQNVEMKAQLADVLIANPSLAERIKRANEQ